MPHCFALRHANTVALSNHRISSNINKTTDKHIYLNINNNCIAFCWNVHCCFCIHKLNHLRVNAAPSALIVFSILITCIVDILIMAARYIFKVLLFKRHNSVLLLIALPFNCSVCIALPILHLHNILGL